MTIERNNRHRVMICDECGEDYDTVDADDFDDMVERAKRANWLIVRDGKLWLHYCPDCRKLPGKG
jgi:hypothetical protein